MNQMFWEQYKLGQIYMVTKVCSEMTDPKDGAGVESIANEPCKLDKYGESQFPYLIHLQVVGQEKKIFHKNHFLVMWATWKRHSVMHLSRLQASALWGRLSRTSKQDKKWWLHACYPFSTVYIFIESCSCYALVLLGESWSHNKETEAWLSPPPNPRQAHVHTVWRLWRDYVQEHKCRTKNCTRCVIWFGWYTMQYYHFLIVHQIE